MSFRGRQRDPIFILRKWIAEQTQARTQALAAGGAQTFADYQRSVGYLEALKEAEEELVKVTGNQQEDGRELG